MILNLFSEGIFVRDTDVVTNFNTTVSTSVLTNNLTSKQTSI